MNAIIPYLCVQNSSAAIAFYEKAFGAKQIMKLTEPDGKVGHAEVEIGGSLLMLSDEYPGYGVASPQPGALSSITVHLTVPNVDEVVQQAKEAGAVVEREPKDEFYGGRSATLIDPSGHRWMVMTIIEKVSAAEVESRFQQACEGNK